MSSTLENNSLKRLATSFGLVAAVVAFMVMLAFAFSPSSVSADTAAQAGNVDANAHAAGTVLGDLGCVDATGHASDNGLITADENLAGCDGAFIATDTDMGSWAEANANAGGVGACGGCASGALAVAAGSLAAEAYATTESFADFCDDCSAAGATAVGADNGANASGLTSVYAAACDDCKATGETAVAANDDASAGASTDVRAEGCAYCSAAGSNSVAANGSGSSATGTVTVTAFDCFDLILQTGGTCVANGNSAVVAEGGELGGSDADGSLLAMAALCGYCTATADLSVNATNGSDATGFATALSILCFGTPGLDCEATSLVESNATDGSTSYAVGNSVATGCILACEANAITHANATDNSEAIALNGTAAVVGCFGGGCQADSTVLSTSDGEGSLAIGVGDAFVYDAYGATADSTVVSEADSGALAIGLGRSQAGICDVECSSTTTVMAEGHEDSHVKAVGHSAAGTAHEEGCDGCLSTATVLAYGTNDSESIAVGNSAAGNCRDCTSDTVVMTNASGTGDNAVAIGSSEATLCEGLCSAATVLVIDTDEGDDNVGTAFSVSGDNQTGAWVLVVNTGSGESIGLGHSHNAGGALVAVGTGTSADTGVCQGDFSSCSPDGPVAKTFVEGDIVDAP